MTADMQRKKVKREHWTYLSDHGHTFQLPGKKEKNKKATRVVFRHLNQKCILHEFSESLRIFALGGLLEKEGCGS